MSNQLQNKLLHYEVQPPQGVWNNIAASLNENFSNILSEKLYEYEANPSPNVWKKISGQLNNSTDEKGKVIPFHIRYRRPLKYSSAVAIFIFLAVLTSLLISKKTESEIPAENLANINAIKKDSFKTPAQTENSSAQLLNEINKPDRLVAKTKISKPKESDTQTFSSFAENLLPRQAERNKIVNSSLSPDKYMIYSDGDGNAIRLPKKIFSAFACPVDDLICKQHLQQLREKFAASAMTADFNGLLQILKSLQENQ
jgi:hypothetical protein